MATEDDHPAQPDIAAMPTDQTSACSAARDAIAAGGEVIVWDGLVPASRHVGVFRIRLRSCVTSSLRRSRWCGGQ
ncbi:hypothetical protein [Streptomyces sp. NBC_00576]|uniref:hypothetical protein n=1 Tax=Streptomyces sp. NBC_00576 TaxID=2903665 RepID=UPI002E814F73|nr:hypothetical protein [Streptomyces sp. NBC_00576]WUB76890.1 hypothetical protein OG734_46420 [Streptomyces sp. NBC_00576]